MQLSAKAVAVVEDQGSAASAFCALEVGPDWGCVGFEGEEGERRNDELHMQ
jgi:hypothetical protein